MSGSSTGSAHHARRTGTTGFTAELLLLVLLHPLPPPPLRTRAAHTLRLVSGGVKAYFNLEKKITELGGVVLGGLGLGGGFERLLGDALMCFLPRLLQM